MSNLITSPFRPKSLKNVATVVVSRPTTANISGNSIGNNASDSKGTLPTINALSLSFGPLAPGAISETKIIYLNAPNAQTINNIRIALVDAGGITFTPQTFGIDFRGYIDYNLVPETYFQGVNTDNSQTNLFNVNVGNLDNLTSQYVYLNVRMPPYQAVQVGVCRYRWYFEWA